MNQWEFAAEAGVIYPGSFWGGPVDPVGMVLLVGVICLMIWIVYRSFYSTG